VKFLVKLSELCHELNPGQCS